MGPRPDPPEGIPGEVWLLAWELVTKCLDVRGREADRRARSLARELWDHRERICPLLDPGPHRLEREHEEEWKAEGHSSRKAWERDRLRYIVEVVVGLELHDAKVASWRAVQREWKQLMGESKCWRALMMRYRRLKGIA